jgi:hypothetical protein
LNQSGRKVDDGKSGNNLNLQQIVGMVCYIRFLLTFIFNDVTLTIKNPKNLDGKNGTILQQEFLKQKFELEILYLSCDEAHLHK